MVISQYLCAYVHFLTGPESLQSSFINSRHIKIIKKFTLYCSPKSVAAREAPTIWATIIRAVTKSQGSPDWRRFSAWTKIRIRISNKDLRRENLLQEESSSHPGDMQHQEKHLVKSVCCQKCLSSSTCQKKIIRGSVREFKFVVFSLPQLLSAWMELCTNKSHCLRRSNIVSKPDV